MIRSRFVLFLVASVAACEPGTGGRRAVFELVVAPARTTSFRTIAGWEVTLEEACLAAGPIYFHAQPALARLPERLWDFVVPSAHAHPGVDHFDGGEVRGEWPEQLAVDLLGPSAALGTREGIAGDIRSVSLGVHPPRAGTSTACLRGHQAYVVGVATRDGTSIPFEGGLDIDGTGTKRRLQANVAIEIDDGRRLVLALDPRPWLDHAQFDTLAEGAGGARRVIEPAGQVWNAWSLGLQAAGMLGARSELTTTSESTMAGSWRASGGSR